MVLLLLNCSAMYRIAYKFWKCDPSRKSLGLQSNIQFSSRYLPRHWKIYYLVSTLILVASLFLTTIKKH